MGDMDVRATTAYQMSVEAESEQIKINTERLTAEAANMPAFSNDIAGLQRAKAFFEHFNYNFHANKTNGSNIWDIYYKSKNQMAKVDNELAKINKEGTNNNFQVDKLTTPIQNNSGLC